MLAMDKNLPNDQPASSQQQDPSLKKTAAGQQNSRPGEGAQPAGQTLVKQPQPVPQQQPSQPAAGREEKEAVGQFFKEAEPRAVERKEFTPPTEVKEWVKEVKTADEVVLPQPVRDDYGQILVKAARATKPNIKLPLNKPKIQRGLKQKVVNSIAWLATWCLRLIKMFPQRVRYDSSTS